MKDGKSSFNVLLSIEKHIEALKPLLPKQAIVCIGEYPIKMLLKEPTINKEGTLPILIEKSSEDVYSWIPKGFDPYFVLGFEDAKIDTHFWYNVQQTIIKDNSIMDSIKKKPSERLHSAIIFSSIWDGVGSATLPTLISKFRTATIDSLSLAVMPSKVQPPDAHFNAYAALQLCLATEGSTVLLLDRDQVENYEGVDRKGEPIKGNEVINYLLNLFLAKESLVSEISELSRTFNVKLFSSIVVTGASYKIYGSFDNMLDAAWLRPLLDFDLPSSSLLYVLLRMPMSLKDKLPRSKIELDITNWFKEKTRFQSIYITEPVYTDDMTDRIDAVLFVGGFDTATMFTTLQRKTESLKNKAVKKGFMTEDWQPIAPKTDEELKVPEAPRKLEEIKAEDDAISKGAEATSPLEIATELKETEPVEPPQTIEAPSIPMEPAEVTKEAVAKPKRTLRSRITGIIRRNKVEKVDEQKKETSA